MRKGYADTPVGQIHYRELGSGPALLLLHMTASSSAMFERVAPLLARRRRVIAMDTPGFGLSDPPLGPDGAIEHYGRAVVGLVDALGIDQIDVVGFHTGATIALEVATAAPSRVRSLVLGGVLLLEDGAADRDWWRERILVPWQPDGRGEFLTAHREWLGLYVPPDDGEYFRIELIARLQAGTENWWAPNGVIDYDFAGRLAQVGCPLLLVNPRQDNLYASTKRAAAVRPDAGYVEIDGADGLPMTHPEQFAAAVSAFLDRLA